MENSEMSDDKAGGEKSPSVSRSRLRKESIRGHPGRDAETSEPDGQSRKKKMVVAYAAKEQKRYHEKSEVDEKSMEDFREEIKGKTKREQTLKEQKKSKSRLSFEDESKGMIPGSGLARKGTNVVSETVSAYGQKKSERILMIMLLLMQQIRWNLREKALQESQFTFGNG